ncbi:ExbD/TolR family protein [Algiphilus aromaticivorans]|jgi:biopolymer transport protein ExbD|uniref:ExbD/TolR family protein n=1 Tax=Algiphilus aromaticivorans TaxID=382454 RepID=UPI0005C2212F|nr:biopolymer transporter ExbD [Algiphilus aromaticivorans]
MKMRRHSQPAEDTGIDLTPMLDVVFIMLIFFIVTTTFVREAGINVNRPSAQTAEQQDQQTILVAISAKNEIYIDGRQTDVRGLRAEIERLKGQAPDATVVVQADRDAGAGIMVEVMDQARLAGARNVSVAAEQQR